MDRVAFTIFGIDIMWYGILISTGVILGTIVAARECRRIGFSEDTLLDFLLFAIPAAIIGARTYYVIFSWDYYSQNLAEIINIRNGGMAIHGGVLAGVIVLYIFCKKRKVSFFQMADIISPSLILGQAIGRWGNFINREAHGGPTNLPWGIMVDGVKVHPTFLYESIGNFLIFFFLMWLRKNKNKSDGEVFSFYLILYGILRFLVEGLRTDSLMFLGLRQAQLISIALTMVGVILLIFIKKKNKSLDV